MAKLAIAYGVVSSISLLYIANVILNALNIGGRLWLWLAIALYMAAFVVTGMSKKQKTSFRSEFKKRIGTPAQTAQRQAPAQTAQRQAPARPAQRQAPARPAQRQAPDRPAQRQAPDRPAQRQAPDRPFSVTREGDQFYVILADLPLVEAMAQYAEGSNLALSEDDGTLFLANSRGECFEITIDTYSAQQAPAGAWNFD